MARSPSAFSTEKPHRAIEAYAQRRGARSRRRKKVRLLLSGLPRTGADLPPGGCEEFLQGEGRTHAHAPHTQFEESADLEQKSPRQ